MPSTMRRSNVDGQPSAADVAAPRATGLHDQPHRQQSRPFPRSAHSRNARAARIQRQPSLRSGGRSTASRSGASSMPVSSAAHGDLPGGDVVDPDRALQPASGQPPHVAGNSHKPFARHAMPPGVQLPFVFGRTGGAVTRETNQDAFGGFSRSRSRWSLRRSPVPARSAPRNRRRWCESARRTASCSVSTGPAIAISSAVTVRFRSLPRSRRSSCCKSAWKWARPPRSMVTPAKAILAEPSKAFTRYSTCSQRADGFAGLGVEEAHVAIAGDARRG